jgi:hypothetical protein
MERDVDGELIDAVRVARLGAVFVAERGSLVSIDRANVRRGDRLTSATLAGEQTCRTARPPRGQRTGGPSSQVVPLRSAATVRLSCQFSSHSALIRALASRA